ncbi:hypothetical protein DDE83_002269 [Stemphylium lycopersici]|uniref:GRF-like zinc ribbon domain-containing protein n=1 Tax=Stemphylium lycopersici TaxID=183478 RepID=A0A364NAH0_STELY|nr:hypothetical protein DDE83_002269 [Stemphylium lycopersici]
MGLFGVLFCCCNGRRRLHDDTFVEYSYVPSGQSVKADSKMMKEPIKEIVCDTTEPLKEITPPPLYSSKSNTPKRERKGASEPSTTDECVVKMESKPEKQSDLNHGTGNGKNPFASLNTLSKIETVHSSPLFKVDSHKDKKEQDEVNPRPIKPLPQRRVDLKSSSKRLGADVPLTPHIYAEQKTIPEEQQKSVKKERNKPYLDRDVDTIPTPSTPCQPFVFLAGTSPPVETSKKGFLPSPSSSPLAPVPKKPTALSTTLPAPTAVYGLSSTTLPPTNTQTDATTPTLAQSTPPKKPSTSSNTTTAANPPLGTYCPACNSPNTLHKTAAQNLNHGRPYRKCSNTACGAWNGFADARGLTPGSKSTLFIATFLPLKRRAKWPIPLKE